jgi:hypothetical protein
VAGKVKTWVWVIVGIAVVCVLGVVAMFAIGLYFFSQNVESRTTSPAAATREFEAIKAGFPGQAPLIELDRNGDVRRTHTDRAPSASTTSPKHLNVLAFDRSQGRIVQFRLPFWMLRMKADTTIDLNGNRMNLEDLRLTVEDLERYGPSVIVDHVANDGDRVLVWSK